MFTTFDGIEIQVDESLVGSKTAVRFGNGPIIVSPAMWQLIQSSNQDELRHLLGTIKIRQLPKMPNIHELMDGLLTQSPISSPQTAPR